MWRMRIIAFTPTVVGEGYQMAEVGLISLFSVDIAVATLASELGAHRRFEFLTTAAIVCFDRFRPPTHAQLA
jgi:hypothetical protein